MDGTLFMARLVGTAFSLWQPNRGERERKNRLTRSGVTSIAQSSTVLLPSTSGEFFFALSPSELHQFNIHSRGVIWITKKNRLRTNEIEKKTVKIELQLQTNDMKNDCKYIVQSTELFHFGGGMEGIAGRNWMFDSLHWQMNGEILHFFFVC